jgi:hypothetical protein
MVRLRGLVLAVLGAALAAFGGWLLYLTMGWAYPAWVPPGLVPGAVSLAVEGPPLTSLPGLASLVLCGLGGAFALLGLGMLLTGERSRMLFGLVLACLAVYVALMVYILGMPAA